MIITHKLEIDLCRRGVPDNLDAVQGDSNTREVRISLTAASVAWEVPAGATAAVAFLKPDDTRGLYDKLPNGDPAVSFSGNTVTAVLAPQVLTCAGTVMASVVFYDADMDTLATFPFKITVAKNPAAGEQVSNDYYAFSTLEEVNAAVEAWLEDLESAIRQAEAAAAEANSAATSANAAATSSNTAADYANAAAIACQNIAAGINSMADKATGKVYTIGIEAGNIYLQEL